MRQQNNFSSTKGAGVAVVIKRTSDYCDFIMLSSLALCMAETLDPMSCVWPQQLSQSVNKGIRVLLCYSPPFTYPPMIVVFLVAGSFKWLVCVIGCVY